MTTTGPTTPAVTHTHPETGHRYHGCDACSPAPVRVIVEIRTPADEAAEHVSWALSRENDRRETAGLPLIGYTVRGVDTREDTR